MKLSSRLDTALNLLEDNLILADIGCDHGFLSIEYAKKSSKKVYAVDNKKGPLESCKENISLCGLSNKVIPVLSDGLIKCSDDIEQICICGMGGNNIVSILEDGYKFNKLNNVKCLVLQANNNLENLRKYLNFHDFSIIEEIILEDNNLVYEVMKVVKGKQELSYEDIKFGPILRKNKDELFIKNWTNRLEFLEKLVSTIEHKEANLENIEKLNKEIKEIKKELGI